MTTLRIYVCGRLAIETDRHRILERDFPARQGKLLWSYLVVHRQRMTGRIELAEAIWGEDIPDGWDSTLSAVASRLRAKLRPMRGQWPELTITSESGRLRLSIPGGTFVDRDRARAGLHAAETALRSNNLQCALSEARVAMEIAARGFMEGEDAPWIEGERRLLQDIRVHAWECTIEAELARSYFQRAERESEALIGVDPLNEKAYRLQMQASAAMGNRSGAVRAMDRCRTALRETVGINPSPETERLFADLMHKPA
ncbi:hypothetical protein BH23CHL4_BH23CHL4_26740 [soil metagenome]